MGEKQFTASGFADAWVVVLGLAAALTPFAAIAPTGWWLAGLVDTFPHMWASCAAISGAVALFRSRRAVAVALAVIGAGHASRVGLALPSDGAPGEADLRLLLANVHGPSTDYDAVIAGVRAADPDVIVLVEMTQPWVDAMAPALASWPHRLEVPRTDHFGIAVYSRLPISGEEVDFVGVPAIRARVTVDQTDVDVLAVHTLPPKSPSYFEVRQEQLDVLARLADEMGPHAIVAGDLNLVPWASSFRGLQSEGRLRDSRDGFGVQASWPSWLPAPMRIPIDHVLVRGLSVRRRELTGQIGSDHLGVQVDLALE